MTVTALLRRAAPDAELVARFVEARDGAAFAELVRRHGPVVLATCRHVTRHAHDADDAFQATFLVLAKKAHALDPARPVGAWLRGVAVRASKKAARRRPTLPLAEASGGVDPRRPDGEAVAAVRAAVASLPLHQRQAVERCELHGRPRAEVAAELGIRPGTLSSRLALARRALAKRLTRQGFAPAAVPAGLLKATASEVPSRRVVELAEAVMRVEWHGWAMGLVLAGAVGLAGAAGEPAPTPKPAEPDGGRLVVGGPAGPIRFLTPDGTEVGRVTAADAKAAGVELREQVAIGLHATKDGGPSSSVVRSTLFEPAGRVRPDGAIPLLTRTGLVLLTPGSPPRVQLVTADPARVVGWSPDGRRALLATADDPPRHWVHDFAGGNHIPITLPAGHAVADWAADGGFVTTTAGSNWLARQFGGSEWAGIWRVGKDGTGLHEFGPHTTCRNRSAVRLSPDGARILCSTSGWTDDQSGRTTLAVGVGTLVENSTYFLAAETVGRPDTGIKCEGLAWAPDGRRVAYVVCRSDTPDGKPEWQLWVADPASAASARRVVTSAAHLALYDWR